jgi:hypothetical protein
MLQPAKQSQILVFVFLRFCTPRRPRRAGFSLASIAYLDNFRGGLFAVAKAVWMSGDRRLKTLSMDLKSLS